MAGLDCKVHETPVPPSVVGVIDVVDVSESAAVLDAVGFRLVASLPSRIVFSVGSRQTGRPVNRGARAAQGRQSDCLTLFDMAQAFSALARDGKPLPAVVQDIVIRRRRRAVAEIRSL